MQRGGSLLRRNRASSRRPITRLALLLRPVALLIAAAGLSSCASISEKFAGTMSEAPVIGLPDSAPQRPITPAAYPAVHVMPPPRTAAMLTEMERQKLEADLVAARRTQQAEAGMAPAEQKKPKNAPPAKPRAIPVSSGKAIY